MIDERVRGVRHRCFAGTLQKEWDLVEHTPAGVVRARKLPKVWDDVDAEANAQDGCALASLGTLPPYDVCFQGF